MLVGQIITEAELDPAGWGNTPNSMDIDYFGLRVQMRPSTFLKLALPLGPAETNPEVEKYMQTGGKIAYPFLDIKIPQEWDDGDFSKPAQVVGHEGRNRMSAWIKMHGDDPIQVNLLPRGGLRRRDFTPEWIQELSKGLIGQRGNLITDPFPSDTVKESEITEAETRTAASKEIRTALRSKGYKLLGSGADATVWAKSLGPVIKIIMPDDHKGSGTAGDTFMKFYEFCKAHPDLDNLPKFSDSEVDVFQADGKDYVMVTMERLEAIPRSSFEEAMVWILSELSSNGTPWPQALNTIKKPETWRLFDEGMDPEQVLNNIDKLGRKSLLEYKVLYKLMVLLYHRGRINKLGWDLHTENVMMRGNTLVITDPWFNSQNRA